MATYTEEKTAQERRQENYDILYKNRSVRPVAEKKEASPYQQDEAYAARSVNDYKKDKGYFSYSPYARHTIEQPVQQQRVQEKEEMPSTLAPSSFFYQEEAPVEEPVAVKSTAPAIRRISRIADESVDDFEPAYNLAPAKAATKKKMVKKTAAYEDEDTGLSLSTNTKVILALVASIVIIAFTVIFVNSALLNTLQAETNAAYTALNQAIERSADLASAIQQATGADAAASYAASVGMILG